MRRSAPVATLESPKAADFATVGPRAVYDYVPLIEKALGPLNFWVHKDVFRQYLPQGDGIIAATLRCFAAFPSSRGQEGTRDLSVMPLRSLQPLQAVFRAVAT